LDTHIGSASDHLDESHIYSIYELMRKFLKEKKYLSLFQTYIQLTYSMRCLKWYKYW